MDKKGIQKELLFLGIKPSLKGFDYMATAIEKYDLNTKITDLYCKVAEEYNTEPQRVERDIRHAREKMIKGRTRTIESKIKIRFGLDIPIYGDITNGDFIALMKFAMEAKDGTVLQP